VVAPIANFGLFLISVVVVVPTDTYIEPKKKNRYMCFLALNRYIIVCR